MKKCPNPDCETFFLYGDDKVVCPFCRGRLVDTAQNAAEQGIRDTGRARLPQMQHGTAEFVRSCFGGIECHGRIVEIDHQELFYSNRHKMFNTIFRGEPYQLAHQSVEYTIRVENITDGFAAEVMDFCLYGSYLGRFQVGDEVVIRAKDLGNRRVVRSIYNETTSSRVFPGFQIPAGLLRGFILLIAFAVIAMICQLTALFQTGAIAAGVMALAAALMPSVIIIGAIWYVLRSVFFPRRRRR
ncbi:MAG: hypothetical protein Q4C50_05065 [Eubacteriales bacterium]|nr:hypothetical protein [Eubacteriales bacterium]